MDRRALVGIAPSNLNRTVYRVDGPPPDSTRFLLDMGLTVAEADQLRQLVAQDNPLRELWDRRFRRCRYGPYGFGDPTRYSDGSFGVLYLAEERETSRDEKAHHVKARAERDGVERTTEHFYEYSCQFEGQAKDLVPLTWPELTADDYSTCQRLGQEAKDDDLAGLRAPSARRAGGACVPVFSAPSVSGPEPIGRVAITVDAQAGSVEINIRDL